MDFAAGEYRSTPIQSGRMALLIPILLIVVDVGLSFGEPHGGTIVGRVTFQGGVPPSKVHKVTQNPKICGTTRTAQPLILDGSSKGVRDAVVSLENLKKSPAKGPDEKVTISNRNCAYVPRISTITVGQFLEIKNEDPLLHNTHIWLGKKTIINVAQVAGGRPIKKRIKRSGLMRVKCDRHKFMEAYLVAFDHPYYSLTNDSGQFHIMGVPPGRHEVTVWHETLGTLKKEITVLAGGEVSVTFEYSPE